MKVLVADDEERVCALICALIDWEELGLTLCAKAYDGNSALALIKEHVPDLVITDIRMPGLDGLDLIREAKEIQPTLQFIIISGHKQFDYAQTAIKYGVAEYLLKPIKKLELEQTLNKMVLRYHEQQSLSKVADQLQQQVSQDRKQRRLFAFSMVINEGQTELLSHCFSHSETMRFFAVKMDMKKGFHGKRSDYILAEKIEEYMIRESASFCSDIVTHLAGGYIYLLLSYAEEQRSLALKASDALLQFLKVQGEIFGNILFTLGLGREVQTYEELPLSLLTSQMAVAERLVSGPMKRYSASESEEPHQSPSIKPFILGMQGICAKNSKTDLSRYCKTFLDELDGTKISPFDKFNHILACFDGGATFILEHMNTTVTPYESIRQRLENAYSMELVQEAFVLCMQEVFDLYLEDKEETLSKPIRTAQEYLALHFSDELISLESVSEVVNLNSSYFSSLFKKSCNKGFSDYLLDLRIAEAKRLLVNSEFSIAEITQKVGYRDPKHFSRVFKKACQIRPNEYRKLYG